ncbi:MAG: JAB domain-containing protein [Candidatus Marinimicrobia bacterium]|nr:JAB domain-containing protein [Candidatus Neomarinimicrobiota bacterium]
MNPKIVGRCTGRRDIRHEGCGGQIMTDGTFKRLLAVEKFIAIYLNSANEIICFSVEFTGGINFSAVDTRVIYRNAILNNAVNVIILHNHPSGNIKPSPEDTSATKMIKEGLKMLQIALVDSIIIGCDQFFSYADERLL